MMALPIAVIGGNFSIYYDYSLQREAVDDTLGDKTDNGIEPEICALE